MKLNRGHSDELKTKILKKLDVVVHVLHATHNLEISTLLFYKVR